MRRHDIPPTNTQTCRISLLAPKVKSKNLQPTCMKTKYSFQKFIWQMGGKETTWHQSHTLPEEDWNPFAELAQRQHPKHTPCSLEWGNRNLTEEPAERGEIKRKMHAPSLIRHEWNTLLPQEGKQERYNQPQSE